jgi:aminoacyl-tRNA hydrolase
VPSGADVEVDVRTPTPTEAFVHEVAKKSFLSLWSYASPEGKTHGREMCDILVVCDDVNLSLGRLRARATGTEGGHNGLRSVAEALGTIDYARLRLGVGRGDTRRDLANHVLARFEPEDQAGIERAIARSADAVETWIHHGMAQMMSTFNRASEE